MGIPELNSPSSSNITYLFSMEENFDSYSHHKWMVEHWHVSIYIAVVYLITVVLLKSYMKSRPPMNLRGPLVVWNSFLAIFSLFGTLRTFPEFTNAVGNLGFTHSVCERSFIYENRVTAFWSHLFVMSKVWELGDTVFILLRKQPLVFLHWWHHYSTLIFCWYLYRDLAATGRWYASMNYFVHTFMYSYYAVRALKFKPPRWTAMIITTMQIIQMILGIIATCWALFAVLSGIPCNMTVANTLFGLAMYGPHFWMFVKLFYSNYIRPQKKMSVDDKKQT